MRFSAVTVEGGCGGWGKAMVKLNKLRLKNRETIIILLSLVCGLMVLDVECKFLSWSSNPSGYPRSRYVYLGKLVLILFNTKHYLDVNSTFFSIIFENLVEMMAVPTEFSHSPYINRYLNV